MLIESAVKSLIIVVTIIMIIEHTLSFLVGFYVFYMSLMILLNLFPRFFDEWSNFVESKTSTQ